MTLENPLKSFITSSVALVGFQLTICLPFVICAIFIGQLGSSLSLAAYGLANTVMNMGFYGLAMGIQESLGVICSRLYGAQQYQDIWQYLWKSIVIVLSLAALFNIFSIYSGDILIAIGVEEEVALATHLLLKRTCMSLYFQGVNQVINNFLSAQQVTKPLFYLNFISIINIYIFAKIFIDYLEFAEIGFAYTKLCQEIFNFVYYITIIVKYLDKSYFEPPSFESLKIHFWDFFLLNMYTALSFYGECMAFEINTYYAALLHDVDALATWVTYINYTAFYFFISVGFGTAIRNLIGIRIGESNSDLARKESLLYIKCICVISLFLMIFQYSYRDSIARVFASNENVVEQLKDNIALYTFSIFFGMIMPSLNTLYRVVGKEKFMFWSNIVIYPILVAVLNLIFCFALGLGVWGINLGYTSCKIIIALLLAWYLYTQVEWKYLRPVDDVRDSFHESLIERSMTLSVSLIEKELKSKTNISGYSN